MSVSLFDPENCSARDRAGSNWKKWDTVGTKVGGIIRDMFVIAEHGKFKAQYGFVLEQPNGEYINVPVKGSRINTERLVGLGIQMGDELGIEYAKDEPNKQDKSLSPTKCMKFYKVWHGERDAAKAFVPLAFPEEEGKSA